MAAVCDKWSQSDENREWGKELRMQFKGGHTYSVYHCGIITHNGLHQQHPASDDFSFRYLG